MQHNKVRQTTNVTTQCLFQEVLIIHSIHHSSSADSIYQENTFIIIETVSMTIAWPGFCHNSCMHSDLVKPFTWQSSVMFRQMDSGLIHHYELVKKGFTVMCIMIQMLPYSFFVLPRLILCHILWDLLCHCKQVFFSSFFCWYCMDHGWCSICHLHIASNAFTAITCLSLLLWLAIQCVGCFPLSLVLWERVPILPWHIVAELLVHSLLEVLCDSGYYFTLEQLEFWWSSIAHISEHDLGAVSCDKWYVTPLSDAINCVLAKSHADACSMT
jgi:hypothetical protein